MRTTRNLIAASLAGILLGYLVYPPPQDAEETTLTARQLLCEALDAQQQPEQPRLKSVDEILESVAASYGNCHSYSDSADIESSWTNANGDRFSRSTNVTITFQRPDRLRIRFKDRNGISLVSFDRDSAFTSRGNVGQKNKEPSPDTAMLSASVISDGLLDWINSLLMPDMVAQSSWKSLAGATLDFDDHICNHKEYIICGCVGKDSVKLCIDAESFLIDKIETSTNLADFQMTRTIYLSPDLNLIIPDDEFHYARTYEPQRLDEMRIDRCPLAQNNSETGSAYGGTQINGSDQYAYCVKNALEMLRTRDPDSLRLVLKYLAVIDEDDPIGVMPGDVPSLGLPRGSARHSPDFCAALLVYYAQQSKLYSEYREKTGVQPPVEVWTGPAAIHACSERAKQSLIRLKAVPFNIEYMMSNEVTLADPAPWYPLDLGDRK